MYPPLALCLCVALIVWLFKRDIRERKVSSSTLWIAGIWVAILGSRSVSAWLYAFGIDTGSSDGSSGNTVDFIVQSGLMLAAIRVLMRRGFPWKSFVRCNGVLVLLYLYMALSGTWSEIGMTSTKRAVKDFGSVLVALVLLTDSDPWQAIRTVFVRVAYLLFPLSIVLGKYYPAIGRVASRGGEALFSGVSVHKNSLGLMVLVFSLFILGDLLEVRRMPKEARPRNALLARYGMLAMGAWLLLTCKSATSTVCLALGCVVLLLMNRLLRIWSPKVILPVLAVAGVCVAVVARDASLSATVLDVLGRDKTLTGRTDIWGLVKESHNRTILGTGFYSFWRTREAQSVTDRWPGMNTAHNGYLETYLDTGAIGVGLLGVLLLVWGRVNVRRLTASGLFGQIAFVFWVTALVYNNSETSFFRMDSLWFTQLLTATVSPILGMQSEPNSLPQG